MKRVLYCLLPAIVCSGILARAQTADVNKILADTRAALGGEKKIAGVKTFSATGQTVRVTGETSSPPTDMEVAFELPDKFVKKDAMAVLGPNVINRTSGFNGDTPINAVDQPPPTPGVFIRTLGPGGEGPQTPEQQAEQNKRLLLAGKQELARLTLGILASSPGSYPLQFSYAGQAESPDGKADMLDVSGDDGFVGRLFVDTKTHLPLMLTWKAKEPVMIRATVGGPAGAAPPAAGGNVVQYSVGRGQAEKMTPEERDKMMKQVDEQRKAAEARARIVEYRLYYGDYRDVDGVKVPFRLQRSIDGKPTEEVTLDKVKINGRIDAKKFEVK